MLLSRGPMRRFRLLDCAASFRTYRAVKPRASDRSHLPIQRAPRQSQNRLLAIPFSTANSLRSSKNAKVDGQDDAERPDKTNAENEKGESHDVAESLDPEPQSSSEDTVALPRRRGSSPSDGRSAAGAAAGGTTSGAGNPGDGSSGDDDGLDRSRILDNERNEPVDSATPETPAQLLAIPVSMRPLFPGFYKPIHIKDTKVIDAVLETIRVNRPYVGVFLFRDHEHKADIILSPEEVYETGVFAQITSVFRTGSPGLTVILYPHRRINLSSLVRTGAEEVDEMDEEPEVEPIPAKGTTEIPIDNGTDDQDMVVAHVEDGVSSADSEQPKVRPETTSDPPSFLQKYAVSVVEVKDAVDEKYDPHSPSVRAMGSEIIGASKEVAKLNHLFKDQVATFAVTYMNNSGTTSLEKLADFAAAVSTGPPDELQEILVCTNVEERAQKALILLRKELMSAKLQSKISADVEAKINKRHRDYWLMEKLKVIRKELGMEADGKDNLVDKFREKANAILMPSEVRKLFDEELEKLGGLEPAMSEFNVVRNYLDWLTIIPWGKTSKENFGIRHASKILGEDHYGLEDVKKRILEFIAVSKLRGSVEGKILCFTGPPGVGKTSIGKSIARALNREYFRFSVGGLSDVSEIKGHRRTYVGALPGRIIMALKKCQTMNPLILIDEVDKLGRGIQGDPASALLEVLDPEQNHAFTDWYLDVPVDLSQVLFVCTANMTDTIPQPLLDRMEVIQLSGYLAEEKKAIAEQYLAPAAKAAAGLKDVDVTLTGPAIDALIHSYCREAGVRGLKKQIEKVYRKSALKIVTALGDDTETAEAPQSEAEAAPSAAAAQPQRPTEQVTDAAAKENAVILEAVTDEIVKEEAVTQEVVSDETISEEIAAEEIVTEVAVTEDGGLAQEAAEAEAVNDAVKTIGSPAEAGSEPSSGPSATAPSTQQNETAPLTSKVPPDVHISILQADLKEYVGAPKFLSERMYDVNPIGVALGLAWTSMGGTALYVESILNTALRPKTRPGLELTGNLKQVMKESAAIAYSFTRSFMVRRFPDNHFFERARVHLHFPEGASPKDGPSAGAAMTSSLLSLALHVPVNSAVAMTGEITLTGKVLRIGGLREKLVAARRANCNTIIFPKENMADWEELPEYIKEGVDPRPVEWFDEVFDIVFPDLDTTAANTCRACQWAREHPDVSAGRPISGPDVPAPGDEEGDTSS